MMFQNINRSLSAGATLKMECVVCHRRVEWTRAEAMKQLGPGATPSDARRRLSCGHCGGKAQIWI